MAASRQFRMVSDRLGGLLLLITGKKLTKNFPRRFLARRGPKGVAQEVELDVLMLALPVIVPGSTRSWSSQDEVPDGTP